MKKKTIDSNSIVDTLKTPRPLSGIWFLSEVRADKIGDGAYTGELVLINPKEKDRLRSIMWSAVYSGKGVWELKNNDPKYRPDTPFSVHGDTNVIIAKEISGWLNSHVDKGDLDKNTASSEVLDQKPVIRAPAPRFETPEEKIVAKTVAVISKPTTKKPETVTAPAVPTQKRKSDPVSLPPDDERVQVLNRRILRIPISLIRPNRDQPRKKFNTTSLRGLGESIIKDGQNTPIDVIPAVGKDPEYPHAQYELVKGERRWRGVRLAGGTHLDAIVFSPEDIPNKDAQHRHCLIGDSQQEGYHKMDMARALAREYSGGKVSMEELGRLCGRRRSVAWVSQYLALIKLHPDLQKLLNPELPRGEQISFSVACRLARVPLDKQLELYSQICKVTGSRLRLLKTQEITRSYAPDNRAGRVRKPADNVKVMTVAIPRVLSDLTITARYPDATFSSFVEHRDKDEVTLMLTQIREAQEKLASLERKIIGAQRK